MALTSRKDFSSEQSVSGPEGDTEMRNFEDVLCDFASKDNEGWSVENIERAGVELGRNSYPALLWNLNQLRPLRPEVAAVVVPSAWSGAEFPNRQLSGKRWRLLFDIAGYTVDGVPSPLPTSTLRLWRGAHPKYRRGWSWTDDRDKAQWFAARNALLTGPDDEVVWVADVQPDRLLAKITELRGESEYVVDARGLKVTDSRDRGPGGDEQAPG